MKFSSLAPLTVLAIVAFVSTEVSAQLSSEAYESEPTVRAPNVIPRVLLQAGEYQVADEVKIEANMYVFDIQSDYGLYQVRSLPMLDIRTHELRTLAQAIGQYTTQDKQFADQLRGQLTYNANSLVDVVVAPFSMAAQLASNLEQTAQEFGELGKRRLPAQDPGYVDATSSDAVEGAHKRNIAFQLDLDSYSTNPKVQEFLNRVAAARSSGYFTAGVATVRVPSVKLARISAGRLDAEIKNALRGLTPSELDEAVREQLLAMQVPPVTVDGFVNHSQFSPRHKVTIVAHLDFMRGVEQRALIVNSTLAAQSETDALSYEFLVRMLALYHEREERIARFDALSALPVAVTESGRALVAIPVDFIYWDRQHDEVFAALGGQLASHGFNNPHLLVNGTLSKRAKTGISALGFSYSENYLNLARSK